MQLTTKELAALERYRELLGKMRGDGSDASIVGILNGVTLANLVVELGVA